MSFEKKLLIRRFLVKPIYVHTKLSIVDDQWILTGSTNMDNVSFFYSSELSIEIRNAKLAAETRIRLFKEHLGSFYNSSLDVDFDKCFDTFREVRRGRQYNTPLCDAKCFDV